MANFSKIISFTNLMGKAAVIVVTIASVFPPISSVFPPIS